MNKKENKTNHGNNTKGIKEKFVLKWIEALKKRRRIQSSDTKAILKYFFFCFKKETQGVEEPVEITKRKENAKHTENNAKTNFIYTSCLFSSYRLMALAFLNSVDVVLDMVGRSNEFLFRVYSFL